MWPRARFDIDWSDLAVATARVVIPADRDRLQQRVEGLWSPRDPAVACYSVRSGFDLLLRALKLPQGSEVLFSALNIKGMIKVVRRLGLVPVPVDLDLDHLAPRLDLLERAIGPKSRVLVVAHLFGGRIDMAPILEVARRSDLFVVEDCAQALARFDDAGHPDSDAVMWSFGPLKTATALGGALVTARDPGLISSMRRIQAGYPVQSRRSFALRIAKFAGLKLLMRPAIYGLLARLAGSGERDLDTQVSDAVRGVARQGSGHGIRRQPSTAMLALLARRLTRSSRWSVEKRAATARTIVRSMGDGVSVPGAKNDLHVFWALTVLPKDPGALISAMRAGGFDAAPVASLRAIPAPKDRPELEPVVAKELLERVVFVPCYSDLPHSEAVRAGEIIKAAIEDPRWT